MWCATLLSQVWAMVGNMMTTNKWVSGLENNEWEGFLWSWPECLIVRNTLQHLPQLKFGLRPIWTDKKLFMLTESIMLVDRTIKEPQQHWCQGTWVDYGPKCHNPTCPTVATIPVLLFDFMEFQSRWQGGCYRCHEGRHQSCIIR